jgi:hypothetical protein
MLPYLNERLFRDLVMMRFMFNARLQEADCEKKTVDSRQSNVTATFYWNYLFFTVTKIITTITIFHRTIIKSFLYGNENIQYNENNSIYYGKELKLLR